MECYSAQRKQCWHVLENTQTLKGGIHVCINTNVNCMLYTSQPKMIWFFCFMFEHVKLVVCLGLFMAVVRVFKGVSPDQTWSLSTLNESTAFCFLPNLFLPSYWPFNALLNQSEDTLTKTHLHSYKKIIPQHPHTHWDCSNRDLNQLYHELSAPSSSWSGTYSRRGRDLNQMFVEVWCSLSVGPPLWWALGNEDTC